jgi:hypothetical protein
VERLLTRTDSDEAGDMDCAWYFGLAAKRLVTQADADSDAPATRTGEAPDDLDWRRSDS